MITLQYQNANKISWDITMLIVPMQDICYTALFSLLIFLSSYEDKKDQWEKPKHVRYEN